MNIQTQKYVYLQCKRRSYRFLNESILYFYHTGLFWFPKIFSEIAYTDICLIDYLNVPVSDKDDVNNTNKERISGCCMCTEETLQTGWTINLRKNCVYFVHMG